MQLFKLISAGILAAGFASHAVAAPVTYRCTIQSNSGNLNSVMDSVDRIILDEAEEMIRFFSGDTDSGATPLNGEAAQFFVGNNIVAAARIGTDPAQVFVFDKEKGLATHSYILPIGVAATSWSCAVPQPQ